MLGSYTVANWTLLGDPGLDRAPHCKLTHNAGRILHARGHRFVGGTQHRLRQTYLLVLILRHILNFYEIIFGFPGDFSCPVVDPDGLFGRKTQEKIIQISKISYQRYAVNPWECITISCCFSVCIIHWNLMQFDSLMYPFILKWCVCVCVCVLPMTFRRHWGTHTVRPTSFELSKVVCGRKLNVTVHWRWSMAKSLRQKCNGKSYWTVLQLRTRLTETCMSLPSQLVEVHFEWWSLVLLHHQDRGGSNWTSWGTKRTLTSTTALQRTS